MDILVKTIIYKKYLTKISKTFVRDDTLYILFDSILSNVIKPKYRTFQNKHSLVKHQLLVSIKLNQ
jgi:hypothetical protein